MSHLQGEEDRIGDPILTNEVFHAMHVILSLKVGYHEGLVLFIRGWFLKRTRLILAAMLIQISVCAFPSPVPVYCWVQSGTSWCFLAATGGTPAPQHPTTRISVSVFYILHYLSYY